MHEDYRYIEALLENDHKLLNEMYQKFLPRIEAMVRSNSGTKDEAFDIFQEALIIIYRKAKQMGFELTSKFYTYLYGICRNLWLKKLGKVKTEPLIKPPEEEYSNIDLTEEAMEDEKRYQLYQEKMLELSEDCQKIISLRLKKTKLKDIANLMGYKNENTATQKHFKCKKQLVKLIQGDDRYRS